jgi:hypothetical protein
MILHQHRNVLFAFPQQGHLYRKHVEPIKKVLAERAIGHSLGQITIRGSDDANVNADRLLSPDPLEFTFL